jgi:lipopolysaccharide/colanic/teichoic acid biosynthesis glycosyltransferase/nucleoside-diphosphate-sugar epimerase
MEENIKGRDVGTVVPTNVYVSCLKRGLDILLSLAGLIVLSPLYLLISLAIVLDDPGPVFFTQKRVGRNKVFFNLHKFRSMKQFTPSDVPTHLLDNPDHYITRVGRVLRKYSLDELPQVWDIFVGNMSVVGPRPALWNQEDLVAERDKYGANDVIPGLTGWAQINGRDKLDIPAKAKLDGDYVAAMKKGAFSALLLDLRCFFGTFLRVFRASSVVEGRMDSAREAGFEDYGFKRTFTVDRTARKKVLITGAHSYIGTAFEAWAREHYADNFEIDTLDMHGDAWRERDFSPYDVVFHVAGIAHADITRVSEETKALYYAVNTDLALETAQKARSEGVRQFVFMSSMIVYGASAAREGRITKDTFPWPANFYGNSKWQSDKGVRALQTEGFRVAVLRPPMIYGRGSKGNFPLLTRLAKRLPVFPDFDNERSMLYIDNLTEFLCLLMLTGEGGVFFPQNAEYTRTADMVRMIAQASGRKLLTSRLLNPAVSLAFHIPGKISGLARKAFGNRAYDQEMSRYDGLDYQKVSLEQSIQAIESPAG